MISVKHLLSGSLCTNVQLTVAWEKGKVKGKKKAKGMTSPSQLMRTRCSPELPGILFVPAPRGIIPVSLTAARPAVRSYLSADDSWESSSRTTGSCESKACVAMKMRPLHLFSLYCPKTPHSNKTAFCLFQGGIL